MLRDEVTGRVSRRPRGAARAARFDADGLARRLERFTPPDGTATTRLVVAWSGGADSTALLAALCELRARGGPLPALAAVHVDHGLQSAAPAWARHCRRLARAWGVPLTVRRVRVARARGASPEAAAREARYRAFATCLRPGDVLLLAQHARDQLETLLLQLMRGAGPRGLAAMPERRALGSAWLFRPLLDVAPKALRDYLQERGVTWVEDPSNVDVAPDRNYLRREVLPLLEARWPGALGTAGRSARLLRETQESLDSHAGRDLERAMDGEGLSLPLLRRLPPPRLAAVLRAWFAARGADSPDSARLAQIALLLDLREDAQPRVRWADCELRRHEDRLLLMRVTPASPPRSDPVHWRWSEQRTLVLPAGAVTIAPHRHGELDLARLPALLLVRTRPVGRALDADGRGVDVKSLLREHAVPPWQRAGLPFLYDARAATAAAGLLAIADLWHAGAVGATPAARRRGRILWRPV